jgi:hypothetical protein
MYTLYVRRMYESEVGWVLMFKQNTVSETLFAEAQGGWTEFDGMFKYIHPPGWTETQPGLTYVHTYILSWSVS